MPQYPFNQFVPQYVSYSFSPIPSQQQTRVNPQFLPCQFQPLPDLQAPIYRDPPRPLIELKPEDRRDSQLSAQRSSAREQSDIQSLEAHPQLRSALQAKSKSLDKPSQASEIKAPPDRQPFAPARLILPKELPRIQPEDFAPPMVPKELPREQPGAFAPARLVLPAKLPHLQHEDLPSSKVVESIYGIKPFTSRQSIQSHQAQKSGPPTEPLSIEASQKLTRHVAIDKSREVLNVQPSATSEE